MRCCYMLVHFINNYNESLRDVVKKYIGEVAYRLMQPARFDFN